MRRIVRTPNGWGLFDGNGPPRRLRHTLAEVLSGAPLETTETLATRDLLAPVDEQEVWAAGVTYERSRQARTEESQEPDVYERVYEAERPELFFKATPGRVVGPGGLANIRSDSEWDVPEPEVVLVLDAEGQIFGYTIGDDVSSRSIEGENPLYLPQAKVYEGSCVVGPWIVPAPDARLPFSIELRVKRGQGIAFEGCVSTELMARSFSYLASWLSRALRFPRGVLLMTGTGLVPGDDFTLAAGDRVEITVDGLGTLEHTIGVWSCEERNEQGHTP